MDNGKMKANELTILGIYEGECADADITNKNGMDIPREVWEKLFSSDEFHNLKCMDGEIWKDIPEFEELYQFSNYGRLRSKDRCRLQIHPSGKYVYHTYKGKLIALDFSVASFGTANLYDRKHKVSISCYQLYVQLFGQDNADNYYFGKQRFNELPHEEWKEIDGYPNYLISNLGRVCKVNKKYKLIISPWITSGYYVVKLSKNNVGKDFAVHRLVAKAFLQHDDERLYVNHKDGNKLNNIVDNLEWCTFQENCEHAWKAGLCKPNPTVLKRMSDMYKSCYIKLYVPEIDKHFDSGMACSRYSGIKYDLLIRAVHDNKSINNYSFVKEA